MIENKEHNRSLVIPKWLPYSKIYKDNDYSFPRKKELLIDLNTRKKLERDYLEFIRNPNTLFASDLLSSAIVIDKTDIAREAADYLKSQKKINNITKALVDKVLGEKQNKITGLDYNSEIRKIRSFISKYPKNPIYWIELARLYTIKGHKDKANKAAIAALSLAPFDRYVVRSGVRFYIHLDEFDKAFYYAKRAASFSSDPWLRATEINTAILNEMTLKNIKKTNISLIPDDKIFHYSELIESIGVLELKFGSNKKAKNNFKLAWRDPSENVIAHGEWILRNIFPTLATNTILDFKKSPEAFTWQSYYNLKLNDALSHVRDWSLQEPYSTHPFLCGSDIACQAQMPKIAIKFAKDGLIANPEDLLLKNNLAFAYLKLNNTQEAENILTTYPKSLSNRDRIFYLATSGLLNYKKGNTEEGRKLYLDSIKLCQKIRDKKLVAKAFLHLAIIELECHTQQSTYFAEKALSLSKDLNQPDIIIPRQHVSNILKRFPSLSS